MNFDSLAAECAPHVAPSTLRALATVESGLNPYAIGVVGGSLQRQPTTLLEGLATANALKKANTRFSAGLVQVYVGNWPAYGLTSETVFEPCTNVRAAAAILAACFQRATPAGDRPQQALRKAISCYYSNNFTTGFAEGYVQKVVAAAMRYGDASPTPPPERNRAVSERN